MTALWLISKKKRKFHTNDTRNRHIKGKRLDQGADARVFDAGTTAVELVTTTRAHRVWREIHQPDNYFVDI